MSQEQINQERRDAEIARSGHRKMGSPFSCKVVGVSFVDSYPANLRALDVAQANAEIAGEPLVVIFVRNPDNVYDTNAIEVHVPALGPTMGAIGHLTRPIAQRLAPELDSGERWSALVESVLVDPDFPDRPGISIKCARVAEEQQ